jgi:maltose-binding protein MalE
MAMGMKTRMMRTGLYAAAAAMLCAGAVLTAAQDATAAVTGESPATPEAERANLVVWVPDAMLTTDPESDLTVLQSHVRSFEGASARFAVDLRLKSSTQGGGILPMLRNAANVAPGALPDLTLLTRAELDQAVRDGLVQPLAGLVPASLLANSGHLGVMGQIDGTAYGLPYVVDLLLTGASAASLPEDADWSFDAMLARGLPYAQPLGARSVAVNQVLYLQYLAAGGSPPTDDAFVLNRNALDVVLRYYEQAHDAGVVDARMLEYPTIGDYATAFLEGEYEQAALTWRFVLTVQDEDMPLAVAPVPTSSGEAAAMADGWVWVVITNDRARQVGAADLAMWMMNADREGEFAGQVDLLPANPEALQNWLPADPALARVSALLASAVVRPVDEEAVAFTRLLQEAVASIVRDERTARDAAEEMQTQLNRD